MVEIQGGKFLTFFLGKEEYGVPISSVKEINGMMDITPVPKVPKYIKGVINLRGKIVPVMDLRLRFGMEELDYTERTCLIVFDAGQGSNRLFSIAVDAVSEVLTIQTADIEQPTEFDQQEQVFLSGLGKAKSKVVLLLDVAIVVDCLAARHMERGDNIV